MKHNIEPVTLPLGLGTCNAIEVKVNYSIGDPTTDLAVQLYDGNTPLLPSPKMLAVPRETMQAWNIDLGQILTWATGQIGAVIVEP
jgi:hypothetical protein